MTVSQQDRQDRSSPIDRIVKLRRQIAIQIAKTRVSPNMLSLLGLGLCSTAGLLVATGTSLELSSVIFLVGSLMDLFDGPVAEVFRKTHNGKLGSFIDALSDKVGEVFLLAGLMFRVENLVTVRLIGVAALLGLLSSYSKSASKEYQIDIRWPEIKVFGRGLRVAILVIGLLTTGLFVHSLEQGVHTTIMVLTAFNSATFIARVVRVLAHAYATRKP
jgi:phosphatidylglycerophosphate synthase